MGPKWFICPKQNLLLKRIIKIIFIYLLAPFNRQNFKKILRANPELWACAMFGPKIPQFVLNKIFWYKPLLLLSSTYWSFSLGKIQKKNSYSGCRIMRMRHFLDPKWFICPKRKSFWKIINITLTHLLDLFIVQNFKKILPVDPDPLWPISQMRILFRKLVNEPRFFHSWLSTFQKSKSDIYLLAKYWRLKNTEISLTENNFWL